jgi:hypothetical protein
MMAKSMSCRPSQVLQIEDAFVAYAVDSAVIRWGTAFEAALTEAGADANNPQEAERRQDRTMRRWVPSTRRYA